MAGNGSRVTQTYRRDEAGVVALLCGPEMRAALLAVVQEGKKHAEGIAPRQTGRYAGNFETSTEIVREGRNKRAQANLENVTPYAASLEWGTAAGPGRGGGAKPQRILGRTQEALRSKAT